MDRIQAGTEVLTAMPNSILWIGLVVLWVFVLFPILADRHPRIRRTTDAALATRVLHRGDSKRRTKSGPAAGHETDPNWRPRRTQRKYAHSDDAEDRMTTPADDPVTEGDLPAIAESAASHPESDLADTEPAASELTDTDTDTDTADADLDTEATDPETDSIPDDPESDTDTAEVTAAQDDAVDDDEVQTEDRSGEARPEPATARIPPARSTVPARIELDDYPDADYDDDFDYVPTRRGRGGYDPEADAIARAARYTFRQRAVLGLVLAALLCGGLAVALNPLLWWGCGLSCLILVAYLTYLRRQVRIEEDIRRRRAARLSRDRQLGEPDHLRHAPAPRGSMDRDTARALRRRSSLLEMDDEDPMFDHLDPFDPATARALRDRTSGDMRRAAGE